MRIGVGAVLAAACLASCAPGTAHQASPSPASAAPVPATESALAEYYGSYSVDGGDLVVIARLGWFYDMASSAYRTIYATGSPSRFTIGIRFKEPLPKFADLAFDGDNLEIAESGGHRIARRIRYKETDVTIPAQDARLAATITEPTGPGPHAGIVVVHGAERGERFFYDIWVGIYASLGLAVLTYDKRGSGSSTGEFPGEFPTTGSLTTYADDAAAALNFLSRWPGVDPKRVGFHGGSQGGWTVPLAMQRHPGAAFAVLASAPATTVDQTDLWAGFSGGGETMPVESTAQMLAEVRGVNTGYDPAPALRALTVPALWLLGTSDRTVPTEVCVQILAGMEKQNFTIQELPTGHGLLVNPTGLLADDDRSPGLAPGLLPSIRAWMMEVLHS